MNASAQVHPDYDLLIVGGGMVGASLAISLSGHGLRIGLVEAWLPGDPGQPSYDDRAIALAYGSKRIFDAMQVWDEFASDAEPIASIHVSDRGHFGFSHLSAQEESVPALGYVVTARRLGQGLLKHMQACPDVEVIAPAKVVAVSSDSATASVTIDSDGEQRQITTRLLVAADGGNSFIREQLQIPTQRWEYGQTAIVTNITPAQAHNNVAFERFTDSGPVALLPMTEGRCAVVWTVRDEDVDAVLGLDDKAFLKAFQTRFGYRLGRFVKVGARASYPLSLLRVKESVRQRTVIIGNAAHTLHPIAGQGFNLGIRDVAALVEVVLDAHRQAADIGDASTLAAYEAWRLGEQRDVAWATDALARVFSNPLSCISGMRNLGLLAVDALPGARHRLARHAMGVARRLPRLARGVSIG